MSSIAAGTSTGTALVSSGDTTGNLVLQVNGTTPSLTLNAAGAHGVGSSPSYGTAGQVLTSAGSAAEPTWSSAGGMTLLTTLTPTSGAASISATGLASSKQIVIVTAGIALNVSSVMTLNISANNGSSYVIATNISSNQLTPKGTGNVYNAHITGIKTCTNSAAVGTIETASMGPINAVQITITASTFTGAGVIYVYGIN